MLKSSEALRQVVLSLEILILVDESDESEVCFCPGGT